MLSDSAALSWSNISNPKLCKFQADGSASQERMERGPFMVSQHHLRVLLAKSKVRASSDPCPQLT